VTELAPISQRTDAATFPVGRVFTGADGAVIAAAAAAAAVTVGRMGLLFRYRIDSDETQHLHMAWAWANGLLQYRDVFDNHMPLFHILTAPLVALAGERTQILVLARMAMLPLFAMIALLAYRIGSDAYPRRAAAWATVIGCLVPDFFLCSLEFRTDDLWTACWLASIAILLRAGTRKSGAAWAGLMLGLAAAVSAKTALLAICLGIAAVTTHLLMRDRSRVAVRAISFITAALVPPTLIAAYFALRGAWQPFLYCTISHNLVSSEHPQRILLLPVSLAIIVAVTRRILRHDAPPLIRKRRLFLFLAASSYGAALVSLWPIIETEHWLPFYPLAAVAILPLLLPSDPVHQRRLAIAIATVELLWIVQLSTPWRDNVAPAAALIAQTTRLTVPTESVIDLKGEMLFRRRATYLVLEKITKRGISQGRLKDTIAADVLRTRAMVAIPDNDSFPRAGRAFLNRNFISVGAVRVAGLIVPPTQSFRIEVPGEYSIVAERGTFRGQLDGVSYLGPRFLGVGTHTLAPTIAAGRNAVLWQRAAAMGLSPWAVHQRPL
jgi:hypothetical protein